MVVTPDTDWFSPPNGGKMGQKQKCCVYIFVQCIYVDHILTILNLIGK